jgi:hypothetical protein
MLGNPQKVLDMENERVLDILPYYLRDCGYDTVKPRKKNIVFEIMLNDTKIGELNRTGELSVEEELTAERDKIISVIEYLNAYLDVSIGFMGQRTLIDFDNTILSVYLDKETCKHRFYVFNAYLNIKSDKHMEKLGFDSLEEAKAAFIKILKKSLTKMCKKFNALPYQQCEINLSMKNGKGGDSHA